MGWDGAGLILKCNMFSDKERQYLRVIPLHKLQHQQPLSFLLDFEYYKKADGADKIK